MVKITPVRLILSLMESERVWIGGMMKKANDHVGLQDSGGTLCEGRQNEDKEFGNSIVMMFELGKRCLEKNGYLYSSIVWWALSCC